MYKAVYSLQSRMASPNSGWVRFQSILQEIVSAAALEK
jgi:hypothetical protein